MNAMKTEKLIKEIEKHKLIYVRDSIDHRDKEKRAEAWLKISAAIKHPEHVCRHRWRSLRDRFVRECTKKEMYGGDVNGTEREWEWFQHLSFLRDQIRPRKTTLSESLSQPESVWLHCKNENSTNNNYEELSHEYSNSNAFEDASNNIAAENETLYSIEPAVNSTTNSCNRSSMNNEMSQEQEKFFTFMENMQDLAKKQFQNTTLNKHDGFLQMVCQKLDQLPVEEQDDSKMFYLNYLHNKIKEVRHLQK